LSSKGDLLVTIAVPNDVVADDEFIEGLVLGIARVGGIDGGDVHVVSVVPDDDGGTTVVTLMITDASDELSCDQVLAWLADGGEDVPALELLVDARCSGEKKTRTGWHAHPWKCSGSSFFNLTTPVAATSAALLFFCCCCFSVLLAI